jgi:hypothetical protein
MTENPHATIEQAKRIIDSTREPVYPFIARAHALRIQRRAEAVTLDRADAREDLEEVGLR